MYYYHVAPASSQYRGNEPLTYQSDSKLVSGQIVLVAIRTTRSLGIVIEAVARPSFATQPILSILMDNPIPTPILKLLDWLQSYYPAPLSTYIQLVLPPVLTTRTALVPETQSIPRMPMSLTDFKLRPEQHRAYETIVAAGTYVLHGETGSGKTRVYEALAHRTLVQGQSVIVLTPEIGLTPQLAASFTARFGAERIVLLHSGLPDKARRRAWLKLLHAQDRPMIVIGPRSALFAPVHTVGLIVVDEMHETSYKQENTPRYHTLRVAAKLGALHQAPVVFGSATPSVSDYYMFKAQQLPIVRLELPPSTSGAVRDRQVQIVDMRQSTEHTADDYLSQTLLTTLRRTLESGKQALLFINRRGSARVTLCNSCGWQAVCPHCDIPLTYHHDTHQLRCHICNHKSVSPVNCPTCHSHDITLKSIGSKAVMARLEQLFPGKCVARFDADNTIGERLVDRYEEVLSGSVDILVGTQIIAKGLDLPNLSLVGVINADASLYIPDFSAGERTYQLLHQLIGRVGRGHGSGTVILQTYTPDNPVLQAAAKQSWQTFYDFELKERAAFQFPPFVHVLQIRCARATAMRAEAALQKFIASIRTQNLPVTVDGPAPAFHERHGQKYTWQVLIKSKRRATLLAIVSLLPKDWSYDLDPINVL